MDELIKPDMRAENEEDKTNVLPSESDELHPTFEVDGKRFTQAMYDARTPGLFKVEATQDKLISLCSKMYYAANNNDNKFKVSCKGIQKKDNNNINYEQFENVLNGGKHNAVNSGFRYHGGVMKTYEQSKCGISGYYYKRCVAADGRTTTPLDI